MSYGSNLSEYMRGFADRALRNGEISRRVYEDLKVLANEAAEVESERDERHVVTAEQHMSAIQAYLAMLVGRNEEFFELKKENDKMRELIKDMWPAYCFAQSGYEVCLSEEEDMSIRDRVILLGIEVSNA